MPHVTPQSQSSSLNQVKAGMRAMWMAGDFGVIARTVQQPAEELAARLNFARGTRVLDVATGTGNLALPLARAGAIVTGVDLAPNLLEQARQRADAEGLSITFDEGDAEALPYADGSFDAVVTIFGAMFAPRPDRVAAEFARVLRPGGTLAMGNWTPGGFGGRMFALGAKHAPPPPLADGTRLPPPVLWGDAATVHQRLENHFTSIRTEVIAITIDMPFSPAGTVEYYRRYFGPTLTAFNRLAPIAQQSFADDLTALWAGANLAADAEHQTVIANEYLQVLATRR